MLRGRYSRHTGLVACELAASDQPDSGWRRIQPGHSIIPHGPPGSFDASVCFAAAHPLARQPPLVGRRGDEEPGPRREVSQNGYLLSRRGRSLP
eukprot:COSAG01_NODE_27491_length_684_cov_1.319658_1_plen_93_part_10